MKNVKYGKCVRCGRTYEAKPDLTNCECGGILDIVYDYDYIKTVLTKEKLAKRENRSMWRYRELLPVEETTPEAGGAAGHPASVGEGRRPEPHRQPEGPGQRHGRGQGL